MVRSVTGFALCSGIGIRTACGEGIASRYRDRQCRVLRRILQRRFAFIVKQRRQQVAHRQQAASDQRDSGGNLLDRQLRLTLLGPSVGHDILQ